MQYYFGFISLLNKIMLCISCHRHLRAHIISNCVYLNGLVLHPFLELSIIKIGDVNEILMLGCQQNRVWSDCMHVQAGLAVYLWQRLINSVSSRVRLKHAYLDFICISYLNCLFTNNTVLILQVIWRFASRYKKKETILCQ